MSFSQHSTGVPTTSLASSAEGTYPTIAAALAAIPGLTKTAKALQYKPEVMEEYGKTLKFLDSITNVSRDDEPSLGTLLDLSGEDKEKILKRILLSLRKFPNDPPSLNADHASESTVLTDDQVEILTSAVLAIFRADALGVSNAARWLRE